MQQMETRALNFSPGHDKLNIGILGVGDVAWRDYLPELHRLRDRIELGAVCAKHEGRARTAAKQYHARNWYTDAARIYADPEINAVINLTPIQAHFETNLELLRNGKHAYTEKPLASTVAEAKILCEEAEQHRLVLACAPAVLLFPQVRFAKSLYDNGEIGEVFSARAYGHGGVPPWRGYPSDPSPFFIQGGGPALDMGVYPLHALTGILGPVKRVTALTSRTRDGFVVQDGPAQGKYVPIQVDDNWQMLLDFGTGRIAYVAANNCVQDSRAPQLELHGLKGTIALNLLDVSAPVEILRVGSDWERVQVPHQRAAGPDHILGVEHLVDCLEHARAPVLSAQHAIHVLDIIEHAARSAAEGRTLAVTSTF